jgi:hypothetical protein
MADDGLTRLERKEKVARETLEATLPSSEEVLDMIKQSMKEEVEAVVAYERRRDRMKELSHKGTLPRNTEVWNLFKELVEDKHDHWMKLSHLSQTLQR